MFRAGPGLSPPGAAVLSHDEYDDLRRGGDGRWQPMPAACESRAWMEMMVLKRTTSSPLKSLIEFGTNPINRPLEMNERLRNEKARRFY